MLFHDRVAEDRVFRTCLGIQTQVGWLLKPMKAILLMLLLGGMQVRRHEAVAVPRDAQASADLKAIAAALEMYKLNAGVCPTTDQGLQALVQRPQDPWGRGYHYKQEKDKCSVWSTGADPLADGDDIREDPQEEGAGIMEAGSCHRPRQNAEPCGRLKVAPNDPAKPFGAAMLDRTH